MRGRTHLIVGTLSALEISLILGLPVTPVSVVIAATFSVISDIDEPNSNVMSKIITKNTTKNIHDFLIYLIMIVSFYNYIKTDDNVYIGALICILLIFIIQKKLTINLVRSFVISSFILLLALTMLIFKINIGIVILTLMFSLFPLSKHRGITHSLTLALLIYAIVIFIELTTNIKGLSVVAISAFLSHLCCDIVTKRGIPIFYPFTNKYYHLGKLKVNSFFCNFVENVLIFSLCVIFALTVYLNGFKIALY